MEFKIEVNSYEDEGYGDDLERQVIEKAATHIARMVEEKVEKRIDALVEKKMRGITNRKIDKYINKILRDGWCRTDDFGNETGVVTTVESFCAKYLTDSYSGEKVIDKALKQQLTYRLDDAIKDEIERIKKEVRKEIDAKYRMAALDGLKRSLLSGLLDLEVVTDEVE